MLDQSKKRYRLRIIIPAYAAFNVYSYLARVTTALGPVAVATAADELEGWDVEVIDENNFRLHGPRNDSGEVDHEFLQRIRPADVVGFYGGLTSTIPRVYSLARFYKQKGCITIAGGQHFADADVVDEAFDSGVDYLVFGEGEETIKQILHAFQDKEDLGKVKGIAYRLDGRIIKTPTRPEIVDFDSLPLPNFSLVRYAKLKSYSIGRIRGCEMNCEFCTVKGKPRCASPERILAQISSLVETRDARHFFIVDDLFGQQRDETIRFCEMLRDYQIKIATRLNLGVQIRLDKSRDTQLLTAMRQAGICSLAIGYESPIDEDLQAMNKRLRAEEMIAQTKIYHKFGFLVHGMFIFGYPRKDGINSKITLEERVERYRDFIRRAKVDSIQVLLAIPLPGTEFRQRLKGQNRIYPLECVGWQYYDGNFPIFEPDAPFTSEQIQDAVKQIMEKFYRFRYMFMIGFNVLAFATMIFYLHNIKAGWRRWYRNWRNHLVRFIGWLTMRGWMKAFKKDNFRQKLAQAKEYLKKDKKKG
ncbi:B12-binding domain-containing radical SAM protein [Candidatus Omnitrophota bacterium]